VESEEEFKLRIDPKSCPKCHGKACVGDYVPEFCSCPLGQEKVNAGWYFDSYGFVKVARGEIK